MNYQEMKEMVGALLEAGGFPTDEPLASVQRITESHERIPPSAQDVCAYSWVLSSFGQWERAEAVARSITNDDDERGLALAILAQKLATAGLLDRAERVARLINDSPELTGVMVEKATALIAIASKFVQEGKPDRAMALLTAAELTAKQRQHADHLQASLLGEIAATWMTVGQSERAIKLWDAAVDVARESIQAYRSGGTPDVDSWKALKIIARDLSVIGENERAGAAMALIDNVEWRERAVAELREVERETGD